ncbi:unnamed protein product [Chironomus riparius]|uniref:DUF4780 domain-containing protein n=1 Tax=Chironomus riparius TaxID=315576 RepID=A0A9N9RYW4_9DIPT|nr:unnamed protein product [Chironomus riparius]
MGKTQHFLQNIPNKQDIHAIKKNKGSKHCSFCGNHNKKVLEKGHRNCKHKKCECLKCSTSRRKIETAKRFRKNKKINSTNSVAIPASFHSELMDVDSTQSSLHNLRVNNQRPSDPVQINLSKSKIPISGALFPPSTSNAIMTEEIATFLRKSVDDKIDEEMEGFPSFSGDWIEGGAWRMNFVDYWTLIWFVKVISTWTFNGQPFEFHVMTDLPTFKYFTFIPGLLLDDTKILQRIFKLNNLDTAKWVILDKRQVLGGFEVDFQMDLISAHHLEQMNNTLNFGMNQIQLGLIESVDDEDE